MLHAIGVNSIGQSYGSVNPAVQVRNAVERQFPVGTALSGLKEKGKILVNSTME
jgi:hypothetical protein